MNSERPTDELDHVRGFRSHLAEVPPGLQARLEERLWGDVLAEEARLRGGAAGRRRWRWGFPMVARQGVVAMAVAAVVLAVGIADQRGTAEAPVAAKATSDPLAAAMLAIGGDQAASEASGGGVLVDGRATAPLVATRTMVVFENGAEMPLSQVAAGPAAMSPEELALLPTDERLLLGLLRAAGGTTEQHDADFEPFRLAALYLSDPRVPVSVRVALMRMLRVVDGIAVGGSAVDVFGRAGVVVSRSDQTSGLQQQYLLDPDNGRLLEHREFVVLQRVTECPPGSVIVVTAYDSTGFPVPAGEAAYGNWPETRPECDPSRAS
jgi:hypothetical protein